MQVVTDFAEIKQDDLVVFAVRLPSAFIHPLRPRGCFHAFMLLHQAPPRLDSFGGPAWAATAARPQDCLVAVRGCGAGGARYQGRSQQPGRVESVEVEAVAKCPDSHCVACRLPHRFTREAHTRGKHALARAAASASQQARAKYLLSEHARAVDGHQQHSSHVHERVSGAKAMLRGWGSPGLWPTADRGHPGHGPAPHKRLTAVEALCRSQATCSLGVRRQWLRAR